MSIKLIAQSIAKETQEISQIHVHSKCQPSVQKMVWFDTHTYFQIKTFVYKVIAWDSCNKKLNRKKSTGTLYVKKKLFKINAYTSVLSFDIYT